MDREELLYELEERFAQCELGDYSPVDDFIEENEADYDRNLMDTVFRYAIGRGIMGYLEEHIFDVDLTEENLESYLDETDDEEIREFLTENAG